MKSGWKVGVLGDVATVVNGGTPKSKVSEFWDGEVQWLTPKDMGQMYGREIASTPRTITKKGLRNSSAQLIPERSVILSTRAPIGHLAINAAPMAFNQGCRGLIPKDDLNHVYLYYFLVANREVLNGLGTGATFRELSAGILKSFTIPLPPLEEQQRIVAILDEAFAGIATAVANTEQNLANTRELFDSYLNNVFTQRSDLPSVAIGDVADVFDGPHATPKTVDVGPIFLGIGALQDGSLILGKTRHVTTEDFRQWTRRVKPETDDVVFSYETRLGQAAIIPKGLECCLGRRMGLVRVDRKRVDPRYFLYQYLSPPFRNFLSSRTVRGATVDRIPLKEFPSFPILLPSLAEQEHIANQFESLRAETRRLESLYQHKRTTLADLKQSLLHKAFSGALTSQSVSALQEAVA